MAEIADIMYRAAGDIAATVIPLVGTTYSMPEYIDSDGNKVPTADMQAYGTTRVVPPVTVFPIRPMLQPLTQRMEAGKASISVEIGTHDIPRAQYTNKPEVKVSEAPLTLAFTQTGETVVLSGAATPGNVIGLQCGDVSTSYVVKQGDSLSSIVAGIVAAGLGDNFFPIVPFGNELVPSVFGGLVSGLDLPSGVGFTVDLPAGAGPLQVNIGTTSLWIRPVQYRRRFLDALIWTNNGYDRQFFGRALESMYDMGQRLPMTDGTIATVMECQGAIDHDNETPEGVFVRRIRWVVDYTSVKMFSKTTIVATLATMTPVLAGDTLADFSAPTASQL